MLHKPIFKVEKYGIPFYLGLLTTFMVGHNDKKKKKNSMGRQSTTEPEVITMQS